MQHLAAARGARQVHESQAPVQADRLVPELAKMHEVAAGAATEVEQHEGWGTFNRAEERRVVLGNVVIGRSLPKRLRRSVVVGERAGGELGELSGVEAPFHGRTRGLRPVAYNAKHMDPVDYNFMHAIASFAATSKTGEVFENRDMLLTNTRAPVAEFNQAFLKRPDYKLSRALDKVIAYYEHAGLPFCLQFPSEHASVGAELEARGFTPAEPIPGMVISPLAVSVAKAEDLTIRQATDGAVLADFQRTAFESFGYPVELAALALTEELMRLPHAALFVGYVGDEPACCSALVITGDMAGIYWVGTRERHRRRGLGAAMTAHAVEVGRERGCRVASLEASRLGAPVYRRMGFTTTRHYLRFNFQRPAV